MEARDDRNIAQSLNRMRPTEALFHFNDVEGFNAPRCMHLRCQTSTLPREAPMPVVCAAPKTILNALKCIEVVDGWQQGYCPLIVHMEFAVGQDGHAVAVVSEIVPDC